ncbi:MAG: type II toxin-antitoxin system VapC family toxin [Deferrisomatales bacterium]
MLGSVVDASALAAVLFAEPHAEEVRAILRLGPLSAPHLLGLEIASVGLRKLRAHPAQREAVLASFTLFQALELRYLELDHSEVLQLAARTALTAYDAAYLWLAASTDLALVTLDKDLAMAARAILPQGRVLPHRH